MGIYEQIENPLTYEFVENLITRYSNGDSVYEVLTDNFSDNKPSYDYIQTYHETQNIRDELIKNLFSMWKYFTLKHTSESIDQLIKIGVFENDYKDLIKILSGIQNINTEKEYETIKNKYPLIQKYSWDTRGQFNGGFKHIDSSILTAYQRHQPKIMHRLYLNTEAKDTEFITYEFFKKCIRDNLPFYLKYYDEPSRDDTIIIYSSTEHLHSYINIIEEILNENKDLHSRMHNPPILTGKIKKYIGYGSEPDQNKRSKDNALRFSFNTLRTEIIQNALYSVLNNWIYLHRNDNVLRNQTTLKEYIIKKTLKQLSLKEKSKEDKSFITKNKELYDYLYDNFDEYLLSYLDKSSFTYNKWFKLPSGNSFTVWGSHIERIKGQIISKINNFDPLFKTYLLNEIKAECEKYGVDPNNIAFDIKTRNEIRAYESSLPKRIIDSKKHSINTTNNYQKK